MGSTGDSSVYIIIIITTLLTGCGAAGCCHLMMTKASVGTCEATKVKVFVLSTVCDGYWLDCGCGIVE